MIRRVITACLAAAGLVLTSVGMASASIGAPVYALEQAGYEATGGHFTHVQTTITLPASTSRFISNFGTGTGPGLSVQLWGTHDILLLGVSTSNGAPSSAPWDASFAVLNTTTRSEIASCLAGNNGGTGGVTCDASTVGPPGAYASGAKITESVSYDPANGVVTFSIGDGTSGNLFDGTYVDTSDTFGAAYVNGELATSPFSSPAHYTPPASPVTVARFTGIKITTVSGRHGTMLGPWVTHTVTATTTGTSTGGVLALPGPLSRLGNAFNFNLK